MAVAGNKHPFTDRSVGNVPNSSGVYSLYKDDKVVYIGQSGQLQTRLQTHLRGGEGATQSATEYKYERTRRPEAREAELLEEFKAKHRRLPRCNTRGAG